ncbi:MAG: hypothetical protein VKN33_07085 [Candidatus Sericytochromatia bacterium]|nr:hypothetical protein [Candidatus Sericytochromatia bacterium]
MIYSRPLLKTLLCLTAVSAGATFNASPASALLPSVKAGAGLQVLPEGPSLAASAWGSVDVLGWGATGHFWRRLTATPQHWFSLAARRNMSLAPMIAVAPMIGIAGLGDTGATALGPFAGLSGRFAPILMPFAFEAQAGAAWINGSLVLPYSLGAKISLIPLTAVSLRWRGWEGSAFRFSGPEIGLEAGF